VPLRHKSEGCELVIDGIGDVASELFNLMSSSALSEKQNIFYCV